MAERHKVAELAEKRWGPQGLDAAEKLLNRYPADVVAYAAEETFKDFDHLSIHGCRFWQKICRERMAEPPAVRLTNRGQPSERPMTRQQRKMARYAEIAFGEGEDDGDERGEAVGQADHGGPRREDQVHGRAGT